jgi:ketosteroid isomerase-like protein
MNPDVADIVDANREGPLGESEILEFAERFMQAIQAGDAEGMRACYAPGAKIWHNTDDIEQSLEANVKSLNWFITKLPDRHYRVLRREALSDGFLQQHVLEATFPDGTLWKMSACVVVKMEGGLITRLDEYLDSAEAQPLRTLGR